MEETTKQNNNCFSKELPELVANKPVSNLFSVVAKAIFMLSLLLSALSYWEWRGAEVTSRPRYSKAREALALGVPERKGSRFPQGK